MDDHSWHDLAGRQAGMIARRQLNALGITHNDVRHQIEARRWRLRSPTVVSTTTGPLSWEQRRWLGVLHAGPGALIGGLTAAGFHGLARWERSDVSVLVEEDAKIEAVPGISFVRTRRDLDLIRSPRPDLPVARLEPAVLLFAGYVRSQRTACGLLAACVQQRLTTPARLGAWVDLMRPLRRARLFRSVLGDIDGGAQSMSELDIGRICRRFGLRPPDRQVARSDRHGRRRWTDCEWTLPDGRVIVLEVDGAFHMEAERWTDDLARQRKLTTLRRVVVRATSIELRLTPREVVEDLIALGVPSRGSQASA